MGGREAGLLKWKALPQAGEVEDDVGEVFTGEEARGRENPMLEIL